MKYSIGDLIYIGHVKKTGIVIDSKSTKYSSLNSEIYDIYSYSIYWVYDNGEVETAYDVSEGTIDNWFRANKIKSIGYIPLNKHYPVIPNEE